jgi:hypothetical protein
MNMTRQQVTLLGIFALFLAPVLLVLMMRSSWWQYQPEKFKNRGQLVQPPVQLPLGFIQTGAPDQDNNKSLASAINGKWLLLYIMPENCERRCTDEIVSLRQIHKAAGRQGKHLSIVVLNTNKTGLEIQSTIESIYQELNFVANPPAETLATLAGISAGLESEKRQPNHVRIFVSDPMLNVMLAYGEDANPGDISKDLKRLLNWSRQDKEQ